MSGRATTMQCWYNQQKLDLRLQPVCLVHITQVAYIRDLPLTWAKAAQLDSRVSHTSIASYLSTCEVAVVNSQQATGC